MSDQPTQPATQKTRPKKGDPVDIPIPTKQDVFGDLAKTARPKSEQKPRKGHRKAFNNRP
jgi:hypothetical protein